MNTDAQAMADECRNAATGIEVHGPHLAASKLYEAAALIQRQAAELEQPKIVFTLAELKEAVAFLDGEEDDTTEVTIQSLPERTSDEGELMPAGNYIWLTEYPDEGCMQLFDAALRESRGGAMTATLCWCGDVHDPHCPTCDKCGAPITTGEMALFCPNREQCEFYPKEGIGEPFASMFGYAARSESQGET